MRILKIILFIILGIVGIALIVAAFVPKKFHAEGKVTIDRPIQEVYDYVKMLGNQQYYSIWFEMGTDIKTEYSGTDGTVGAKMEWDSKEVGDGKQIIRSLDDNKKVVIDLYLMGDKPADYVYNLDAKSENTTEVSITLDAESPYPLNITNLFFDMNPYFQKTADKLKTVLEK